ncbi:hypothetical protein [Sorangium sp. So ce861]|uniref:hypothetical protein n=1 Tax=Sorangium sp. So ce861 TaxID=3133323 RepID=UPI003F5EAAB0
MLGTAGVLGTVEKKPLHEPGRATGEKNDELGVLKKGNGALEVEPACERWLWQYAWCAPSHSGCT